MLSQIKSYCLSYSTVISFFTALLMYVSYSLSSNLWKNSGLLYTCTFIGFFLPFFSRISNKVDEKLCFRTAFITPGRFGRFIFQYMFNYTIFTIFMQYGVVKYEVILSLGGIIGITFLATAASQGIQYVAITLANREIGNNNRNVVIGLSVNTVITAVAATGFVWIKAPFTYFSIFCAVSLFMLGLFSDIRSIIYPKGGIGVFFGTFNPFHNTHLAIIKKAIEERELEKVYLHSTVIPKLHAESLRKNEIVIAERLRGMRVYAKTANADVHVNYFPTGNKFYEYETRKIFMELAIKEAGLEDQVEVLSLPDIYESEGFYGIISYIKQLYPHTALHGIHGSDLGGMWVRRIYDESGWIYPYSVRRIDNVSATAIRNGAKNMAPKIVETVLEKMNSSSEKISIDNKQFTFKDGVLIIE